MTASAISVSASALINCGEGTIRIYVMEVIIKACKWFVWKYEAIILWQDGISEKLITKSQVQINLEYKFKCSKKLPLCVERKVHQRHRKQPPLYSTRGHLFSFLKIKLRMTQLCLMYRYLYLTIQQSNLRNYRPLWEEHARGSQNYLPAASRCSSQRGR